MAEMREELDRALRASGQPGRDRALIAYGRKLGRAEVREAVEEALDRYATELYTPALRIDAVHVAAIRAALEPYRGTHESGD